MEKELESKIFMVQDYLNKEGMEKNIKEYICKLKNNYPCAIVTREFYKGRNVLIRATKIDVPLKSENDYEKEDHLEKEEVRIKEKGINDLGENVFRKSDGRKRKERTRGGEGRERC